MEFSRNTRTIEYDTSSLRKRSSGVAGVEGLLQGVTIALEAPGSPTVIENPKVKGPACLMAEEAFIIRPGYLTSWAYGIRCSPDKHRLGYFPRPRPFPGWL